MKSKVMFDASLYGRKEEREKNKNCCLMRRKAKVFNIVLSRKTLSIEM